MLHVSTQPCYLGWYRPREDGQTEIGLTHERFNAADIDAYNQAITVIGELRPFLIDFMALEADFEALKTIAFEIVGLSDRQSPTLTLAGVDMIIAQSQLHRAFANMVQAGLTFAERAQSRLSQHNGQSRPSAAWHRLVNLQKTAYDKSLGVRLLTLIGKTMRHAESPIAIVPLAVTSASDDRADGYEMRPILDTDILLRSDALDGALKAEILSLRDRRLDLLAVCDAQMRLYATLMLSLIKDRASDLYELEQFEARVTEKCQPPEGAIAIIWEGPHPNGEVLDGSAYHFCFDESRFLFNLAKRLGEMTG